MSGRSRLAVLIVTWNSWEDVEVCLPSVEAEVGKMPCELVIVDSASSDGTPDRVEERFPRWRVIRQEDNVGFAIGNNIGFAATRAPIVFLLNPDTRLEPGCLRAMLDALQAEPDLGVVGPLKVNSDGSWQPSWGRFPGVWEEFLRQSLLMKVLPVPSPQGPRFTWGQRAVLPHDHDRDVDWVSCSGLMLRREAVDPPLFNDGNYMYREEVDLCRRVRAAGWRVRYLAEPRMLHRMGTAIGRDRSRVVRLRLRGEAIYYERNDGPLKRWACWLLMMLGSWGRALIYRLLSVFRPARRAQLRELAGAYGAAAGELALALVGRLDLQRAAAPRA